MKLVYWFEEEEVETVLDALHTKLAHQKDREYRKDLARFMRSIEVVRDRQLGLHAKGRPT